VRNEEVVLIVKKQRNILHEISERKVNWIGHILRRNCLLQRVIEVKINKGIEVIGRRGRRRRKLLDDLKERRGYSDFKEEAVDRTMWRARCRKGCGRVVRQTTKWRMNEWMCAVLEDVGTRENCCEQSAIGPSFILYQSSNFPRSFHQVWPALHNFVTDSVVT
jgi:hypothetical protein